MGKNTKKNEKRKLQTVIKANFLFLFNIFYKRTSQSKQ